jgi:hypothetical protein
MRALMVTGVVRPDHTLTVQVPSDVPSGMHELVIVINSSSAPPPEKWQLPVHDVGPWPKDFTVRREDIYDDDGR